MVPKYTLELELELDLDQPEAGLSKKINTNLSEVTMGGRSQNFRQCLKFCAYFNPSVRQCLLYVLWSKVLTSCCPLTPLPPTVV